MSLHYEEDKIMCLMEMEDYLKVKDNMTDIL